MEKSKDTVTSSSLHHNANIDYLAMVCIKNVKKQRPIICPKSVQYKSWITL